jgi:CRISPR-associated protein Csx10
VVTQQRVSMGRGAGKAFHTTAHLHIPGSVLRGALAKAWIARRGLPDSDFRRLFDGRVRFGPLFAEGSSVLPLSVRVCKYLPTHCTPWYADAAFPAAAGAAQPPTDWDDATGHWRSGRGDVVGPGGTTVPNDPVASTAIEPSTGTAKEANLFSRDSLRPGLVFTGAVVGDDAALQLLIEAVSDLERLELGGRSSVMGSARLSLTGIEAPVGPEPSTDRVVLRLASPAFLVDNAGRPTLDVASALRRRAFSGEVERVWARSLTDGTGGFHGASRLPKPVDVGLAAGTTIALRTADDDIGVLGSLVTDGIGLRRSEGFGWLEVATGPWTTSSAVAADDSLIGEEGQDAGAFGDVRRRVQDLRLGHAAGRWFVARLRDVATTGGPSVDEALSQPGAMVLSRQQRQQVADVLAGQSPVVRRQLADSIDAGGQA